MMYQSIGRTTLALAAAAALSLIVSTGCFSYTTAHTATPVEKGRGNISARAGYTGITSSSGGDSAGANVPYFEFSGRYGISENIDFGAKLYPIGAGLDFNFAVVNSSQFALSINPAFSMVTTGGIGDQGSATYGTALANVLADVVKTDSFILTLGVKPGILYAFANAPGFAPASGAQFAMGGTLGAKIWASDNFAIMPWIDVLAPVNEGPGSQILFTGMIGATYKI